MAEQCFQVMVVDGRACCRFREVAQRMFEIDLVKAANVRGFEDALFRRVLFRRATGRTASEEER
jgi:hypothetical protein